MATAKKTVKVQQIASPLRCHFDQRQTLIGLGLNKVGRVRELPDTPQTHGMIRKLPPLVRIVEETK